MKTKRFGTALFLVMIILLVSACGAKEYKPEAINEEVDKCVICNMAVKDDPYATQIITTDGQSLKFDDIGCMNEWKVKNGQETVGAEFVRDHNSGDWIKYERAYYAYDAAYVTPMAYGVIAFEDKSSAQAYIDEQGMGQLLSSEELANHKWEVNRDMMDMEAMEMHNESMHSDGSELEMDMGHGTEGENS
ncbi:nitrous oxide reductase accessory protein NosL [Paenibacillus sp. 2TAB23]|uniref:nitrous oxide reductase accessory protein NosL n=1 Tax=Paenibacillus sp. 2TAB23 TaxID=3233004 RepID=UPI003F9E93F5